MVRVIDAEAVDLLSNVSYFLAKEVRGVKAETTKVPKQLLMHVTFLCEEL